MKTINKGLVYVIATPIGNLEDITIRAIKLLQQISYIFCEDTRNSKKLITHIANYPNYSSGVKTSAQLISLHQHNEKKRIELARELLQSGENIAIISDAGTPAISDPGAIFINVLYAAGFKVIPLPGACAAISAFSVSGICTNQFSFLGFLPEKNKELNKVINNIFTSEIPTIIYEAPHRILTTMEKFAQVFSQKQKIFVAREISKIYEEYLWIGLDELIERLKIKNNDSNRGEWVIIIPAVVQEISKNDNQKSTEFLFAKKIVECFREDLPSAKLAKKVHQLTGVPREEIYNIIVGYGKN